MFVSCHPLLSVPARTALTLRLIAGLTVPEIARAYLVPEPTIAQRIVRAKKTIAQAAVAFEVPSGPDRASRLGSVLQVIYLVYNEGYSATSGEDWLRPELCAEALRLGRVLAGLGARGTRGLGSSRVDGIPILPPARPRRAVGRARPPLGSGPPGLGPPAHHPRRERPGTAPKRTGSPEVRTCCRRQSPHATHAPFARRKPTGQSSWRCTANWHAPPRRRSSS